MIILQMASEKKNVNLARTSRRRGSGGWLFPKRGTFGIPRGLRRPPRRADAPLSSGTFLIHLRDAGEECPRPPSAPASEFESPAAKQEKCGAPGEIRTPDPLLRRQLLYPPELQAREMIGL